MFSIRATRSEQKWRLRFQNSIHVIIYAQYLILPSIFFHYYILFSFRAFIAMRMNWDEAGDVDAHMDPRVESMGLCDLCSTQIHLWLVCLHERCSFAWMRSTTRSNATRSHQRRMKDKYEVLHRTYVITPPATLAVSRTDTHAQCRLSLPLLRLSRMACSVERNCWLLIMDCTNGAQHYSRAPRAGTWSEQPTSFNANALVRQHHALCFRWYFLSTSGGSVCQPRAFTIKSFV